MPNGHCQRSHKQNDNITNDRIKDQCIYKCHLLIERVKFIFNSFQK